MGKIHLVYILFGMSPGIWNRLRTYTEIPLYFNRFTNSETIWKLEWAKLLLFEEVPLVGILVYPIPQLQSCNLTSHLNLTGYDTITVQSKRGLPSNSIDPLLQTWPGKLIRPNALQLLIEAVEVVFHSCIHSCFSFNSIMYKHVLCSKDISLASNTLQTVHWSHSRSPSQPYIFHIRPIYFCQQSFFIYLHLHLCAHCNAICTNFNHLPGNLHGKHGYGKWWVLSWQ